MNSVIFLYDLLLGLFGVFTAYLMAGVLIDDDFFKFIVAASFSTITAIVGYTTWTIGERPFTIIFIPLIVYLLIKWKTSVKLKYFILITFLSLFLLATHHEIYFMIPIYILFSILYLYAKLKNHLKVINIRIEKISILIAPLAFIMAFSIPFFLNKFIEKGTRYQPILPDYVRYFGPLLVLSIGGMVYLVFKQKKSFNEWFLLLAPISLVPFIYISTYMKWFLPIFLVLPAGIGLINIARLLDNRKRRFFYVFALYLLFSFIFTGYYQFLHDYGEIPYNQRYIEDSTYRTGLWLKANIDGSAISNDRILGERIFAVSEKPFLMPFTSVDQIYGFIKANVSEYERYPLSSEQFWFDGYGSKYDRGETLWEVVHQMGESTKELGIKYVVENMKANGLISWNHQSVKSKLISYVHNNGNLLYDTGNINVWTST
jgi:hypothetical protein